jgi:hypothetical protein
VRLIPEELAIASRGFSVLIDRDQNRLDMVITTPHAPHPPDFSQGLQERGLIFLVGAILKRLALPPPTAKYPSLRGTSREILLPHGIPRKNVRPERGERRARLVTAIARGRRWLDQLSSGAVTDAHQLAKRKRCTVRQVNLTLSLAFLAPQLVKAAVEGRLPRGINIERLRDPHAEWSRQFQELGLDPH